MAQKQVEINELDAADNGRLEDARQSGSRSPLSKGALIGIAAAIAVATGVLGFVGGVQYQKGTYSSSVASQNGFGGNGQQGIGGRMGTRNGTFGEITAITETSITVDTTEGGPNSSSSDTTSKTYTINSATTITVDGSTASVSDLKTGDTVMIEPDSSDSSIAASIREGIGGMRGGQTQSATTDSTSSST